MYFKSLQKAVLNELAKEVSAEMMNFSTTKNYTLLKDSHDALKNFSWKSIWLEIQEKSPILLLFFQKVLPKANKKLLCFLICMMLKCHCMHLSLVQRAVSVLLYGNGCHKQV